MCIYRNMMTYFIPPNRAYHKEYHYYHHNHNTPRPSPRHVPHFLRQSSVALLDEMRKLLAEPGRGLCGGQLPEENSQERIAS